MASQYRRADLVGADLKATEAAYAALLDAASSLSRDSDALDTCQPMLSAYATLLGAPAEAKIVEAWVNQVTSDGTCSVGKLRQSIVTNASLLPLTGPCSGQLQGALKWQAGVMKPLLGQLLDTVSAAEKVLQAADKARDARQQVRSAADVLRRSVDAGSRQTWDGALIRELVVTRPNPDLPWNKVQSHSIVVQANSPYVKEVTLAHRLEEKHDYRIESATGRIIGFGVGLVYTPLHQSTWTAATLPGGADKVITETSRETRAGDLGAFLTYRFMEYRRQSAPVLPILELGVGVSSDHPSYFLGAGVEIKHAARIGFGWSPQRVTRLDAGQVVNVTRVASNDDIRTVKKFDLSNWYISLTFALDSLSLFNKQ